MLKKTSFPIYLNLLLVWSFFFIRKDYIWIAGDDANLATQALEFKKGSIPNIDFVSGYPGLSGKIQSYFLLITNNPILSQHLFAASLSSILIIILFKSLNRTNPWTILLYSIFIFMQQHLVNPTPNPGYLFEIFLVLGIISAEKFRQKSTRIYGALSGLAFAASIMSKQYGIFTVTLFLSVLILACEIKSKVIKKLLLLVYAIFPILFFIFYYLTISLHNGFKTTLTINFFFFLTPCIFAFATFKSQTNPFVIKATFRNIIIKYSIILYSYAISIIIIYLIIYKFSNPITVLRILFVNSPTSINENLALVSISQNSLLRGTFAALMIIFFIKLVSNLKLSAKDIFNKSFITIVIILIFWKMGNLSGTPFVPIITIYLIHISNKNESILLRVLTYNYLLYTVLLIPYSNYSFHMTFMILLLLTSKTSPEFQLSNPRIKFNNTLLAVTSFVLIFALIGKEYIDIDRLPRFQYGNVIFRSGDAKWGAEIGNMANVSHQHDCASSACEFLWLVTSKNVRSS